MEINEQTLKSPPGVRSARARARQDGSQQLSSAKADEDQLEVEIPDESPNEFSFGQFWVYCLLKGYGNDPDTIVKYQVIPE